MDVQEALNVLGLQRIPSERVALQHVFEDKARVARRMVQFPGAGLSGETALDNLDRVTEAWVVLQNLTPSTNPASRGGGVSSRPGSAYSSVPASPVGPSGFKVLWDTFRFYAPKLRALSWRIVLAAAVFIRWSWRTAERLIRFVVAVGKTYIRLTCRVTGATPLKVAGYTSLAAITFPLALIICSSMIGSPSGRARDPHQEVSEAAIQWAVPQAKPNSAQVGENHELLRPERSEDSIDSERLKKEIRHLGPLGKKSYSGVVREVALGGRDAMAEQPYTARSAAGIGIEANRAGACTLQLLTWPPARVYIDGRFLVEAPSPDWFVLSSGEHTVRLVTKDGRQRTFPVQLTDRREQVLSFNFDDGRVRVEVMKP